MCQGESLYTDTTGPVILNKLYFCRVSMTGNNFRFLFHCVEHHVGPEVECVCTKYGLGKNSLFMPIVASQLCNFLKGQCISEQLPHIVNAVQCEWDLFLVLIFVCFLLLKLFNYTILLQCLSFSETYITRITELKGTFCGIASHQTTKT